MYFQIYQLILHAQRERKRNIKERWRYTAQGRRWMKSCIMQKEVTHSWKNILGRILGCIIRPNIWRSRVFCHLTVSILSASRFTRCCIFHNPFKYNSNNIITIIAYTSVLVSQKPDVGSSMIWQQDPSCFLIVFILYLLSTCNWRYIHTPQNSWFHLDYLLKNIWQNMD